VRERPVTTAFWWGQLPHWEVADGRYFVALRLAGAIPAAGAQRLRALSEQLAAAVRAGQDGLALRRRTFATMESWLHQTCDVAHLRDPRIAGLVTEAIEHRQRAGIWQVYEYVVMPNHVHLFVKVLNGRLRTTMATFKTWTGSQAWPTVGSGRHRFWQAEWFDHWSRSLDENDGIQRYIRENPVKAGLVTDPRDWPYGSWPCR
jgi:REP element-mobilizing transposase RayT